MERGIIYLCILVGLLTSGCTSIHTTVALRQVEPEGPRLEIEKRGSGFGSCGYVTNAYWGGDTIKLIGEKSRYEAGEFRFFRQHEDWNATAKGHVAIDRSKKEVEVAITVQGRPYEFNGRYHFRAESTQTTTANSLHAD